MEGTSWVIEYYKETDKETRKQLLQEGIEKDGLNPANELRQQLFDIRYKPRKNEGDSIDYFIKGWVNLRFLERSTRGMFASRKKDKLVKEITHDLGYDIAEPAGDMGRAMLHMELKNMVKFYISLCEDDKAYSTILLGFGHMKKDKLRQKIARDIYDAVYTIPMMTNTVEVFEPLRRAAVETFLEIYPKEKDTLDAFIEEGIRLEAEARDKTKKKKS